MINTNVYPNVSYLNCHTFTYMKQKDNL